MTRTGKARNSRHCPQTGGKNLLKGHFLVGYCPKDDFISGFN